MRPVFGQAALPGGTAVLSPCGGYRYRLGRVWDPGGPAVTFVLLNPSTADAGADDPTCRRCLGFARAWGAGSLAIVNLFAARATDPAALRLLADPEGPENDRHLLEAAAGPGLLVCGWGTGGALLGRGPRVAARLVAAGAALWCLGETRDGHPRHPLYLAAGTPRRPYPVPAEGRGG